MAIFVGNCSWTDPTLIACGRFYPATATSAEARLRFYATRFPIVEVDSTFYSPPEERTARAWAERTPPGFVFDVKAFALLTGHGAPPERLPPALRAAVGPRERGRSANVYLKDLTAAGAGALWQMHRAALAPLHEAGKLGAVLFQFPPWFTIGHSAREHLTRLRAELPDYRIAVEFRGGGWLHDTDTAGETLAFLQDQGLTYVCVDEPQGFRSSTPPVAAATADLAVVRFHGRNAEMWEARTTAASDRFNYLYEQAELEEWVPRIEQLAAHASEVHVLFNNNYQDYGVRNARHMTALLAGAGLEPHPAGPETEPRLFDDPPGG
jgi:uncharacterized protein YecE (DUF72 family)